MHFEYGKTTFYEYVREFFQKKHPESSIPLEGLGFSRCSLAEEVNRLYSQSSRSRKLFQGFFVLQSLYPCVITALFLHFTICQLLESLIIADRVYFLQTHGVRCRVDCVFDRKQSPRCICITAEKSISLLSSQQTIEETTCSRNIHVSA